LNRARDEESPRVDVLMVRLGRGAREGARDETWPRARRVCRETNGLNMMTVVVCD
jgi:hypothetical protein